MSETAGHGVEQLRAAVLAVVQDTATWPGRTDEMALHVAAYDGFLGLETLLPVAVGLRKSGNRAGAIALFDRLLFRRPVTDAGFLFEAAATLRYADDARIRDRFRAHVGARHEEGGISRPTLLRCLYALGDRDLLADEALDPARLLAGEPPALDDAFNLAWICFSAGWLDQACWLVHSAARKPREQKLPLYKNLVRSLTILDQEMAERAAAFARTGENSLFLPEAYYARFVDRAPSPVAPGPDDGLVLVVNSLAVGGSERNAISLANALIDTGPVTMAVILKSGSGENFRALLDPRVEVAFVDHDLAADRPSVRPKVRKHLADLEQVPSFDTILGLADIIGRVEPRIVHAFTSDARALQVAAASAAQGRPAIMNPGGFTPQGRGRGLDYSVNERWMRSAYAALLSLDTVHMMNPSAAAAREYVDWIGCEPAKATVNYFGLDLALFMPDPARRDEIRQLVCGGDPARPVVGGVFRMEEVKRPLLWLDVAKRVRSALPDCRFLLVGDGRMLAAARDHARRIGIADCVHFAGRQLDPVNWYAAMDSYLQTSSMEGFGNVLVEAQALGVPVVAPALGGMPEALIDGVTGYAVPSSDAEELAQAVVRTLEDKDWKDQARQEARSLVERKFSMDAMRTFALQQYGRPTRER